MRTLIYLVFIASLLVACAPAIKPDGNSTDYPGPDINSPADATTYPGPDTPVTSDGPDVVSPYPDPLAPIPGEENMNRGEVFIEKSDILTLESFPPQFVLHLQGNLPTPCHHLRAKVNPPDEQNRVQVEVYSLFDPEEICAQVLKPFENNISLGSFKTGKYTLLVNGKQVGEFEAP